MSHQDYPASTTNTVHMSTRKKRRGMIEKRRRDKINNSLSELRRLVPAAFEKEGSAKLEKAEILQMTVDYLRMLHERGLAGSLTTSIKPDLETISSATPRTSTPISSSSLMMSSQQVASHHHQHHQQSTTGSSHTPQIPAVHPTSQLSSPHESSVTASASMTAASMTAAAAAAAAAVQHQQHQLHQHLTQSHHVAVAAQQHHNQIQQFNYSHHTHHHPDLAQSPILEQFYNHQHHQNTSHHHQRTTMQQLHHQPYAAANCYNPSY